MRDVPIILVVDDEADDLRSLQSELARRFGSDYEGHSRAVARRRAAGLARAACGGSRGRARDRRHVDGRDDGRRASAARPATPASRGQASRHLVLRRHAGTRAALPGDGAGRGRRDYLTRPWIPVQSRELSRPVEELLGDWTRANRPRFEAIRMVGEETSPRCHEIKRTVWRRSTSRWVSTRSIPNRGRRLLQDAGLGPGAAAGPLHVERRGPGRSERRRDRDRARWGRPAPGRRPAMWPSSEADRPASARGGAWGDRRTRHYRGRARDAGRTGGIDVDDPHELPRLRRAGSPAPT